MFKLLDTYMFMANRQYYEEIEGIAEVMEVAVSELLYNNYLTQFDCYSSNVIAKLQTSGKLVHLTSFDFD